MDNKQGLKKDAITKGGKGRRQYADPQSTLINHPTRAKILEVLQERKCSVRELEEITKENRINLYYHLNLLEIEGLVRVSNNGREKIYTIQSLSNQNSTKKPSYRLKIPEQEKELENFFEILITLLELGDIKLSDVDIQKLKNDSLKWVDMKLE